MADEQETIAEIPEAETPIESEAPDTPETQEEEPVDLEALADDEEGDEELADEEGAEPEEPQASEDDDLEEFEWNGKTIKGPKGLKDGVLMQADYTRKTQEVAAQRKELEQYAQRLQEQAKTSDEEMQIRAQFVAKAEELEQYRRVDWQAWSAQDPVEAQQAYYRYQELEKSVSGLSQQIQQRAQHRTVEAQQDLAKRITETREFAKKEIKGYTPEIEQKVVDFALQQGITQDDLKAAMTPTVFKILHRAMLGEQVLNSPPAKAIPKKPVVPLKTVGAKANPPARKSLADMEMEEYVAYRQKARG